MDYYLVMRLGNLIWPVIIHVWSLTNQQVWKFLVPNCSVNAVWVEAVYPHYIWTVTHWYEWHRWPANKPTQSQWLDQIVLREETCQALFWFHRASRVQFKKVRFGFLANYILLSHIVRLLNMSHSWPVGWHVLVMFDRITKLAKWPLIRNAHMFFCR